ncbi:MAG: orotate phosphoribosyltransferase [Nitrososphaerota archaeon]|jgi:orotate phosphoribosyltransferase|nr:orotate phosphoribosyltransferase [Nitrososphaerota archaeon]MDG6942912.1 orotate phosphoribosyltransferase [Nitrososphaerota archaeon]
MSDRVSIRVALADALFNIGALRFGKFKLSSGKVSSYYLDLRVIPSNPEAYSITIAAYLAAAKEIGESCFDVVAGVATAGVTISSPLAYILKKPMVYVRKEQKGHGLEKLVEGAVNPGWRALVIDDLVTTGGSVISSVEALRNGGCVVRDALVLVDRLEGGRANLARSGVKLNAFVDVRELVETLHGQGRMTMRDLQAVLNQIEGK